MICIEQNNTNEVAQELVASLAKHASISLPLAKILARRGIHVGAHLSSVGNENDAAFPLYPTQALFDSIAEKPFPTYAKPDPRCPYYLRLVK